MTVQIKNFYDNLGWQGRERDFNLLNKLFEKNNIEYAIFLHKETDKFEKEYKSLNKENEFVYVCKGGLKKLLNDLAFYNFNNNILYQSDSSTLKLKLVKKHFSDNFIREPELRTVEGEFFLLTAKEFDSIPFKSEPITSEREFFMSTKLNDRVKIDKEIKEYFKDFLIPIKTNQELNYKIFYSPVIKEDVERYVPDKVNTKAFDLAKKHNLDLIEFNFLNFFYETNKAMRNGNGQLFFDINGKGIGYRHDRNWVKKKMKKLIDLELVKFESRHDCRNGKYTSWYFYDADKKLDDLKYDF